MSTVSKQDWLRERKALLAEEKRLTKEREALAARRRALPLVELETEYHFTGPDGTRTLLDLFDGRDQLIVYHFMLGPEMTEGCPGCSCLVDHLGDLRHLHASGTSWVAISRAPYPKIAAYRERMGWAFPWYSSADSRFNYDFHATIDPDVAEPLVNFRTTEELEALGKAGHGYTGEHHGVSTFLRDGTRVLHHYSSYERGGEFVNGMFAWLDLTPLGRREEAGIMNWVRRHDEY